MRAFPSGIRKPICSPMWLWNTVIKQECLEKSVKKSKAFLAIGEIKFAN